jgi:hypothetical protein
MPGVPDGIKRGGVDWTIAHLHRGDPDAAFREFFREEGSRFQRDARQQLFGQDAELAVGYELDPSRILCVQPVGTDTRIVGDEVVVTTRYKIVGGIENVGPAEPPSPWRPVRNPTDRSSAG